MEQDTSYNTGSLSHTEQEGLLRKAHAICETWWFDKLDCAESWARQRVEDIAFEEAMGHFAERALTTVIHRRQSISMGGPHIEVGFRSMESPVDYFLWIIVSLDRADEITNGLDRMSWGGR